MVSINIIFFFDSKFTNPISELGYLIFRYVCDMKRDKNKLVVLIGACTKTNPSADDVHLSS